MDVRERLARRIGTGADLALVAIMALMLATDVHAIVMSGGDWPFDLVADLVICVTALLRARNRAWAAVVGLACYAIAALGAALWHQPPEPLIGAAFLGLLVLGGAAIRTLRPRPAAVIAVAGAVVVAAGEAAHRTTTPESWADLYVRGFFALTSITIWAAALAAGLWLRHLDHSAGRTRDAIRQDERLRLARELHDVAAHHVTGIVVQAKAARFADVTDPDRLRAALGSIETAGGDTLTAIRRLLALLRTPGDDPSPPPESIAQLIDRFARNGPPVELRLPTDTASSAWPPEVAGTVYRITQEALTNVARHAAGAGSVAVTITDDPGGVHIVITDDASAAARRSRPAGGYGLVGIRERVEALGGTVHAGPRPGTGWTVQADLPIPAPSRP